MKFKISIIINILFALALGLYFANNYIFHNLDWVLVSSAKSPNGNFIVNHYQSQSERGHAPYGDNFVISSWQSFPSAHNFETFFAGYCGSDASFKWLSDEEILINCSQTNDPSKTKTSMVNGIKVTVIN